MSTNRICGLLTSAYDGNLRHLCGETDGHVRIGIAATRHRSSLIRECADRARSLGSPVRMLYELWPQTVAQTEDPSGEDLYRWLAYLTHISDGYLRTTHGEIVRTSWGRDFPWLDMRSDAPKATAGPFQGLRPCEWIVSACAQWRAEHGAGYDGLLLDGYGLDITPWIGGQSDHMPALWRDSWQSGSLQALSRIRAVIPCVCAVDNRLFPGLSCGDGGLIEDFGFRRSLYADLYGDHRYSLRMCDANYRRRDPRPPIIVKLHGSTRTDQLPALIAAASMVDEVYLSWYRPGLTSHDTIVRQLDAIDMLQPYREMPVGAEAQWSTWARKPEQLRVKREFADGRVVHLDLPARNVRGW